MVVSAAASAYTCTQVSHSVSYKTTLGFKAFTFRVDGRWCHNGKKVATVSHSSYLSANNGLNRLGKNVLDKQYWYDSAHTAAIIEVEGHVQNCVPKLGCVADYYPYVWMKLNDTGGHNWRTSRG